MGRLLLLAVIGVGILLFGCVQGAPPAQNVVCSKPYIQVGTSCCLDQNSDSICDSDEGKAAPSPSPTITEPAVEERAECFKPYIRVGRDCCLDVNANGVCDKDDVRECPQDVQACPGGSTAGRDPLNNCNFFPCPSVIPTPAANATIVPNVTVTAVPTPTPTAVVTPIPNCTSSSVLNAITSNLMDKSNECRSTRVNVLCGVCSTCCSSPGVDKTEYQQSIDPACYSCANSNFGVARARDYYDRMGAYLNKCVENCDSLVTAYKAFLQYGVDYACVLPEGWNICDDVTLP